MPIFDALLNTINRLEKDFEKIPTERKKLLIEFSEYISEKVSEQKEINLTFIRTHNSRRSLMTQIWAQTAAKYYGIENVTPAVLKQLPLIFVL